MALKIAFQWVQIPARHIHFLSILCHIQKGKYPLDTRGMLGIDAHCTAGFKEFLQTFVGKTLYHTNRIVTKKVTTSKKGCNFFCYRWKNSMKGWSLPRYARSLLQLLFEFGDEGVAAQVDAGGRLEEQLFGGVRVLGQGGAPGSRPGAGRDGGDAGRVA